MIPSQEAFLRDPYLLPYKPIIERRYSKYLSTLSRIISDSGSLWSFANGFSTFGLNLDSHHWILREYMPHIQAAFLIGDFNSWSRSSHPLTAEEFGRWSITLPFHVLPLNSHYKLHVITKDGTPLDCVPSWALRVEQASDTFLFNAVVVPPPKVSNAASSELQTAHCSAPVQSQPTKAPIIYECHIGMSNESPIINTYSNFTTTILPRAVNLGYNTIQLMAIQEHAYYGSFGYHVTSYFASSSRYGGISELQHLLTTAHEQGLRVIMDLVHSHASSNCDDGIAWSGAYTYVEKKHPAWDSALFDYGNIETLRFLLSNVRFWLEMGFDGFRFDGVTSMLFKHHGVGRGFGGYEDYFGDEVDEEGVVYLMLANQLIASFPADPVGAAPFAAGRIGASSIAPATTTTHATTESDAMTTPAVMSPSVNAIPSEGTGDVAPSGAVAGTHGDLAPIETKSSLLSIAEEVSGFPLLARPITEGGLGFTHRLAMAIPDLIIKYLKHIPDEDWDLSHLVRTLTNRRYQEPVIAYAESHDQAIVGDKTIMMWLMNEKIYTDMSKAQPSLVAERAVALHKMIRLIVLGLGGQGWLGFFGNEFGHPEWIDFPREGNNWSYHYCRRQWSLGQREDLRYKGLEVFERAMLAGLLRSNQRILQDQGESEFVLETNEEEKLVIFEKAGLLFIFNFHVNRAAVDREVRTHFNRGVLQLALCTDDEEFGGLGRINPHQLGVQAGEMGVVNVYVPPRVALVYKWLVQ